MECYLVDGTEYALDGFNVGKNEFEVSMPPVDEDGTEPIQIKLAPTNDADTITIKDLTVTVTVK